MEKGNNHIEKIKRTRNYWIFLFIFMIMYEFMDSYTTSNYTAVISYIKMDFGIDNSQFYLIQAIASVGLLLVLLVQSFADRIGRKPMMIITFFGMGFAAFIMHISNDLLTFTFGFLLSWVFFSSDMWVIIISEEAPADKRARYSYIIAVVGALGSIAIPICRAIFVQDSPEVNPSAWRGMNYLAMLAMVLAFFGLAMKETNAFLNRKRNNIEVNENQRISTKDKLLIPFKTEAKIRVLAFMVIGFLMGMMTAVVNTFEDFLTTTIVINHNGDPNHVTNIIFFMAFGSFFFFGVTGVLADYFGRKPTAYLYAALNIVFFLFLFLTAEFLASQAIIWVFLIYGFMLNGSFWGLFMLTKTYCVECFSTEIRGTSTGWRSSMYAVGLIIGSLISSVLTLFLELNQLYLLVSLITGFCVSIIISKCLPETKGINIITTDN